MKNKKMLRKLKRYIKKEWDIKMELKLDDTLLRISELIAVKLENCSIEKVYDMWIINERFKLPNWICVTTIIGFLNYIKSDKDANDFKPDITLKELFDEI